jgi:hypothetical protein
MDPAAKEELEARVARLDRLTELIAVFILSIAAFASSFAGFQSELWDGEQAASYALAEQARTAASMKSTIATEVRTLDIVQFSEWLNAYAAGDSRLQAFYRKRFRPQFERALEEWLSLDPRGNPNAPLSPLEMGSYARTADGEARALQHEADSRFAAGERANDVSDAFMQATVILALALFLGGVVQAFKGHGVRVAMLALATLACVIGIIRIAELPALRITL